MELTDQFALYGGLALTALLVVAVVTAVVKKRLDDSPTSAALKEAADRLGFVVNAEREIAGNVNNDEYWNERIVGIHRQLSVVAGRFEVIDLQGAGGDEHREQLAEVHVDLADRWDCGIDVASRDAPTYGDHSKYLEPIETGDEDFDRDFEVRVQLSETIQQILVSDDVSSLLRQLDAACQRVRIAEGTLQLRYDEPFVEADRWVEAVETAVDAAIRLDDAVDSDDHDD